MPDEISDPFTGLAEGAVGMHVLYEAFVESGFKRDEALYLVGQMLTAMVRPQPPTV